MDKKKIFKRFLITLVIVFIGLPLIYLGAVLGLSKIHVNADGINSKNDNEKIDIYLKNNGVHSDFIFPIKSKYKDWSNEFQIENTLSKDFGAKYIKIGWGDKGFYFNVPHWDSLTFKDAYTAAFGLNESAIHVKFLRSVILKNTPGKECIKFSIDKQKYLSLIEYVERTIERNSSASSIFINKPHNYGSKDSFYEAHGTYSIFHSCNTWVNTGLKEASLPAPFWTVLSGPIFECYQK